MPVSIFLRNFIQNFSLLVLEIFGWDIAKSAGIFFRELKLFLRRKSKKL